jgi:predicted phage-related endonuclease
MNRTPKIYISQAAAVLGLDSHRSPLEVFERITGRRPPEPDNLYMKRGRQLEPLILDMLKDEHGFAIEQTQVRFENHFLVGVADALAQDSSATPCVVECKTSQNFSPPPPSWQLQSVLYMYFAQRQRTYIAVLRRGLWLELFQYEYEPSLLQDALEALQEFYRRYLVPDTPPGPEWLEYVRAKFPVAQEEQPQHVERNLVDVAEEYVELSERIRALEQRREELREMLLAAYPGSETGEYQIAAGPYRITYKSTQRRSLKWDQLPAELEAQLRDYISVSTSIRLSVERGQ